METGINSTTSGSPTSTPPDSQANTAPADKLADHLKRQARIELGQLATALQAQRAGLDWEQRAVERDTRANHRALYGEYASDDKPGDTMGDMFLGDVTINTPAKRAVEAQPPTPRPQPIEAQPPTPHPQRSGLATAVVAAAAGMAGVVGGMAAATRSTPQPVVTPPAVERPADLDTRNVLRFDEPRRTRPAD
ncbi:MAG: hypothetical protein ACPGWS_00545 [Solirubrobacterales bacterium]